MVVSCAQVVTREREKIVGRRRGEVEINYKFGSEAESPHREPH
jgi:hypothetical protein